MPDVPLGQRGDLPVRRRAPLPDVGGSSAFISRTSVDLPAPEYPMIP